ncbi:Tyrosine-protein kinase [Trema orientale]|uniref:non-specific serine/threonine protein kinase n=1 Tax=Trema orientale TaxID=63057 RepID=A0A2P5FYF2_TREOI|nr:Tyrosine-protein kinase [Trema orientale]
MSDQLWRPTPIFGLQLWVVLGVCLGAGFVLLLFFISLWLASKRSKNASSQKPTIPIVSKDIQEVRVVDHTHRPKRTQIEADPCPESDPNPGNERQSLLPPPEEESPFGYRRIQIEIGRGHRISFPDRFGGSSFHGGGVDQVQVGVVGPEVSHLGWGHWYTLRELEAATNGFGPENVVGQGGDGIVYHGVLGNGTQVAVKNLLNNRGQAEEEFKVEVETIGRVRHKNLVRLLGYCAEGAHRMLVYEYVNNANLEQWLHGDVGPFSPLTWEIRMNIILGIAKGYVAPEYASTGMLNERSDVYSFGVLIMEIISGRKPVDYNRPAEEAKLVEWLKKMVSSRNSEGVLDPKLPQKPAAKTLKRALLVALRCVDPNAQERPKMGHLVHMLEADEAPLKNV